MDRTRPAAAGILALARPRVDALLAAAWGRRVTLVIAGGGYGKTTALRALADSRPVRWLGLQPADREIEGLTARLAKALAIGAVAGLAVPTAAIGPPTVNPWPLRSIMRRSTSSRSWRPRPAASPRRRMATGPGLK